MDAVLEKVAGDLELKVSREPGDKRPSRSEAEAAVRTLIRWAGDNPEREGLIDTPERVVKAYDEFFAGYKQDPAKILSKTFKEVSGYDDMVLLRGIKVDSHCEHHMVPIKGVAHVAYMPNGQVVGISKLARLVECFSRRLQTQESMTAEIATALETHLKPHGVAVVIDATHNCMACRGVKHENVYTITRQFRGVFKDAEMERRFWDHLRGEAAR